MTWEELGELREAGWHLGAHTREPPRPLPAQRGRTPAGSAYGPSWTGTTRRCGPAWGSSPATSPSPAPAGASLAEAEVKRRYRFGRLWIVGSEYQAGRTPAALRRAGGRQRAGRGGRGPTLRGALRHPGGRPLPPAVDGFTVPALRAAGPAGAISWGPWTVPACERVSRRSGRGLPPEHNPPSTPNCVETEERAKRNHDGVRPADPERARGGRLRGAGHGGRRGRRGGPHRGGGPAGAAPARGGGAHDRRPRAPGLPRVRGRPQPQRLVDPHQSGGPEHRAPGDHDGGGGQLRVDQRPRLRPLPGLPAHPPGRVRLRRRGGLVELRGVPGRGAGDGHLPQPGLVRRAQHGARRRGGGGGQGDAGAAGGDGRPGAARRWRPGPWASPPAWSSSRGGRRRARSWPTWWPWSGRYGGLYTSHIRNRDAALQEAVDEFLEVARRAGARAELSHLNVRHDTGAAPGAWERAVARMERERREGLDVLADMTPLRDGIGLLAGVLPPWVRAGRRGGGGPRCCASRRCGPAPAHGVRPLLALPARGAVGAGAPAGQRPVP